jgi:hypothetical protein
MYIIKNFFISPEYMKAAVIIIGSVVLLLVSISVLVAVFMLVDPEPIVRKIQGPTEAPCEYEDYSEWGVCGTDDKSVKTRAYTGGEHCEFSASISRDCKLISKEKISYSDGKITNMGKFNVPETYILSFVAHPTGTASNWSNIVRFTRRDDSTDTWRGTPPGRIPAVYFIPKETRLQIAFFIVGQGDQWVLEPAEELPLNKDTKVQIIVSKSRVDVTFDGENVHTAYPDGELVHGEATLYTGTQGKPHPSSIHDLELINTEGQ